jgi:hypothetical protein
MRSKNDIWDIVPRPKRKSVVSSNWLYKIKHPTNGSIEKFKVRFVAREFSQKEGVDNEETFVLEFYACSDFINFLYISH